MFKDLLRRRKLGKRIKPMDIHLIRNFALRGFALVFLVTLLCMYAARIAAIDWTDVTLFNLGNTVFKDFDYRHLLLSVAISVIVFVVLFVLFDCFCPNMVKQLRHRQELARMLVYNKWYVTEKTQGDSFFKDVKTSSREKIVDFPIMYYRFEDSHLIINIKATMSKAQKDLMQIDEKVATGLFCEYVEQHEEEPYYKFLFYHDLERNRIKISDVSIADGELELMKGFKWNYDKKPHALVVGGTGSGKTYFLLTVAQALLDGGAALTILDPKNADLADLGAVLPDVASDKEGITASIEKFAEDMLQRSEDMKKMPNYKMGGNYRDLGLEPHFLMFDEYVAFFQLLDKKEAAPVMADLTRIAMLGRQAGYFLILACQRADAKYMADGLRDQFHFRIALGLNSEVGYSMVFGNTEKQYFNMPAGRGYADMGTGLVTKFYAPEVPEGYDFMEGIERAYNKEQRAS